MGIFGNRGNRTVDVLIKSGCYAKGSLGENGNHSHSIPILRRGTPPYRGITTQGLGFPWEF